MKSNTEKGSALLIVFLLAATVAITLYMEMPVTVFEAQRQKEQMTIDHGKEYAHAVKLFVRKIGRYPSSLDELENTNNMRFLRHKFKDPFTGDNDWRLLHAGPGGMIIDSKAKPATTTLMGNPSTTGSGSNNGTSNSTNSGSNATNSNSASNGSNTNTASGEPDFPMAGSIAAEATAAVQPAAPKRPPAIAANGSTAAAANSSDASTWQSLVPPIPGEQNDAAGQANATTAANTNPAAIAGAPVNAQPAGAESAANGQPGNVPTNGPGQNTAANMQNMVNQMSGSGGQTGAGSTGATFGTNTGALGTMAGGGGGIAGVAVPDKVAGAGIKAVNDQHKYKLWEFYYDPTQDTSKMPMGLNPQGANPQNQTGTGAFGNNNGSAFGSNGNSTTAGASSGTTSQPTPQ